MGVPRTSDSFQTRRVLRTDAGDVAYYSLLELARQGVGEVGKLPVSIRILLESLLRLEDGNLVTADHIRALAEYDPLSPSALEFPFMPARVLLQDFTGVPCVVDLAAMRSAMARMGGDPQRINPRIPVDLVIDHSIQVDYFGSPDAYRLNQALEFERNRERYAFLRWGQKAFSGLRVMPPGAGICHQVNLEYLGQVVLRRHLDGQDVVFPDTLVGTDSHTTMINGLGVLGWGVGGIEAEAAMLGWPMDMAAPRVVGFKLSGELPEGTTATDLVLTVTQMLRAKGVVGQFVEFYGSGLRHLTVPDRATVANMAPEYGATMGFFPVDDQTLAYLRATGRTDEQVDLAERYLKEQGLFSAPEPVEPVFADTLELDLGTLQPSLAGPLRPQDRVGLADMKKVWHEVLEKPKDKMGYGLTGEALGIAVPARIDSGETVELRHGSVVIAAITSCTNTSNPSVLIGAGLLAKKAVEKGLTARPWVKTSLAPGSRVVTEYLVQAGLLAYLEKLGFHVVGYGCTTCIGNSGPLPEPIARAVEDGNLVVASVLSGNRNFAGRVNPHARANYLASPPLVVAYALAGRVDIDLVEEPLGYSDGQPVFLKDLWPTSSEVAEVANLAYNPALFMAKYGSIEDGGEPWEELAVSDEPIYPWDAASTYIQQPPYFDEMPPKPGPLSSIQEARVLALVSDSITTDHISPAGSIATKAPAGQYLIGLGIESRDFNSYGSRRGNHHVMIRGTFANIRLRNLLAPGTEGGWTTHFPSGEVMSIYDASRRYQEQGIPLVVLAGRDYGMGSSRDWAAKGTALLGVKAVIARSFERIHRSNLVGMGVLPLEFKPGEDAQTLGLTGRERFTIPVDDAVQPRQELTVAVVSDDGVRRQFQVNCRLDTQSDIETYRHGGILQRVLRQFMGL